MKPIQILLENRLNQKGDTIIFVGKKGGFFGNEWSILAEYKNGLNGSDILVGDTAWGDVPDNFLEYAK